MWFEQYLLLSVSAPHTQGREMEYPTCQKCQLSILRHRLFGFRAYCDPNTRSAETMSTFTATQVNEVQRILGHTVSESALQKEREERR